MTHPNEGDAQEKDYSKLHGGLIQEFRNDPLKAKRHFDGLADEEKNSLVELKPKFYSELITLEEGSAKNEEKKEVKKNVENKTITIEDVRALIDEEKGEKIKSKALSSFSDDDAKEFEAVYNGLSGIKDTKERVNITKYYLEKKGITPNGSSYIHGDQGEPKGEPKVDKKMIADIAGNAFGTKNALDEFFK